MKYMVTPTGLEPVTSRLGILRSILMSYGASWKSDTFRLQVIRQTSMLANIFLGAKAVFLGMFYS